MTGAGMISKLWLGSRSDFFHIVTFRNCVVFLFYLPFSFLLEVQFLDNSDYTGITLAGSSVVGRLEKV